MAKVQLLLKTSRGATLLLCEMEPNTPQQEETLLRLLERNAKQLATSEVLHLLQRLTEDAGRLLTLLEQLPDLDNYNDLSGFFEKLKKARQVFEPFRLPVTEAELYLKKLRADLEQGTSK